MEEVAFVAAVGDPNFATPPETEVIFDSHRIIYNQNEQAEYTEYTLKTKTTLKTFRQKECKVVRRYNDFVELHRHLSADVSAAAAQCIPTLPFSWSTVLIPSTRFDPQFIEARKSALLVFLDAIVNSPPLMYAESLRRFLEEPVLNW